MAPVHPRQYVSEDAPMEPQDRQRVLDVPHGPAQLGFDPCDDRTWPYLLTVEEIAMIWRRSVGGIKKQCQLLRFRPAPFETQPYRWRKSDVQRQLAIRKAS